MSSLLADLLLSRPIPLPNGKVFDPIAAAEEARRREEEWERVLEAGRVSHRKWLAKRKAERAQA